MKDKVWVITGGGSGLGMRFAEDLAAAGSIPVVADIDEGKAAEVAWRIRERGGRALALRVDVCDEESVAEMVRAAHGEFGRIDGLINNAAILATLTMKPFYEISLAEWDKVIRTNLTGAFLCSKAIAPLLIKTGWGRIVNMSSDTALMGMGLYLHYTASKAAIQGITRSMARELGPFGITVNCILPGATETEKPRPEEILQRRRASVARQCIPRQQLPDDLLGTMRFLLSEGSSFMTGQSLVVNGGACHT
jgi:NAD(P)-dependent dehydrogenase (short-subunit alcohol dehydrogenase family)